MIKLKWGCWVGPYFSLTGVLVRKRIFDHTGTPSTHTRARGDDQGKGKASRGCHVEQGDWPQRKQSLLVLWSWTSRTGRRYVSTNWSHSIIEGILSWQPHKLIPMVIAISHLCYKVSTRPLRRIEAMRSRKQDFEQEINSCRRWSEHAVLIGNMFETLFSFQAWFWGFGLPGSQGEEIPPLAQNCRKCKQTLRHAGSHCLCSECLIVGLHYESNWLRSGWVRVTLSFASVEQQMGLSQERCFRVERCHCAAGFGSSFMELTSRSP